MHKGDAWGQDVDVVIIGNQTVPEKPLSTTDVQNIFLGKKTKLNSTKITFVILKAGEVHERFLKEYLSRTPSQYTKYWKKMVFTGKGKAPKAFATEADLVEYVEKTEGAIGYVGLSTAQETQSQDIHQLIVQ
jgi:ABC-type phosphate transport system substrate-binding protein